MRKNNTAIAASKNKNSIPWRRHRISQETFYLCIYLFLLQDELKSRVQKRSRERRLSLRQHHAMLWHPCQSSQGLILADGATMAVLFLLQWILLSQRTVRDGSTQGRYAEDAQ